MKKILILILLASILLARMPAHAATGVAISALPSTNLVAPTAVFPVVSDGVTWSIRGSNLLASLKQMPSGAMIPAGLRYRRAAWVGLYNTSSFAMEQIGENFGAVTLVNVPATTNTPARSTIVTAASTNAVVGFQPQSISRAIYFPGKNVFWEWAGRFSETNSGFKYFAGLNSETTIGQVATNDSHATRHSAMFRCSTTAAETTWKFITSDGATQTTTDTKILCDTNRLIFSIIEDSAALKWYAYINGVVCTTNSANFPAAAMHTWITAANITNANPRTIHHEVLYSEQDNR